MNRPNFVPDFGSEEELLAAIDATIRKASVGDTVEGVVVKVRRHGAVVDIGYKNEYWLPSEEMAEPTGAHDTLQVGDEVTAIIIDMGTDRRDRPVLSQLQLDEDRDPEAEDEPRLTRLEKRLTSEIRKSEELQRQRAQDVKALEDLREQHGRQVREIADLRAQVDEQAGMIDSLRVTSEQSAKATAHAQALARSLWASMPAEGRLKHFESPQSWLPEWIVHEESPSSRSDS